MMKLISQVTESKHLSELAVSNLRKYLQIPSVQPDVDYDDCIEFLKSVAEDIGLAVQVFEYVPKKPILVATWVGEDSNLPTILLNSHMDVVPVVQENWTYDPFGAEMDDKGNIYARGAQDMKTVGIQYLEAIRKLKQMKVELLRTVHVSFVPDEEIGGVDGMQRFVASEDFKKLNVGVAFDEGIPSSDATLPVFNGERTTCQYRIRCPGETVHGLTLSENTAGQKVTSILKQIYEFRETEIQKLKENPTLDLGDVTSINVTILEGGVQQNVVPPEFIITVDSRVATTLSMEMYEVLIRCWMRSISKDITIEYIQKEDHRPVSIADDSNPFWVAFKTAAENLELNVDVQIMPGATDIRFVRELGISAFGFTPLNNTTPLAHGNDEYVNSKIFLKGIDIYCEILTEVGRVDGDCI